MLNANFDSWLLTHKTTDERLQSKVHHDWHGDIIDITGMADIAHSRLLNLHAIGGSSD